ncbi:DUF3239 domain-containing protein [Chryseobacterium indoltheticum]|uniref:DUF3239 domain-containing protein n=1 Tax=Chryseobacterium indoltheticum TaxID=254 RepID=UPI00191205B8|nr:DUF3239 domain-containing protein [Chryseobacterium indoltheticum]QQQ28013.1 DUF3239 domain-containing protein [Chryseobacterium indoltheticum]
MKDDREIFTLDSNTVASNPGRVKVMPLVLMRHIHEPIFLLIALLASIAFTIDVSLIWGGIALLIFLAVNIFYWRRKKEHFAHGDSNGGIVISENPKLVAVTTNLSIGFGGNYPVVKIISYKGKKRLNDRIGTVALYQGSNNTTIHWEDFFPVPVEYVNNNKIELENVLQSYSEESWKVLQNRIQQINKPYREGLFKIYSEESNW